MEENDKIAEMLKNGDVGVLPTDTLYGLVGSALLPETVERIYQLQQRDPDKPLIVLIADVEDIEQFGVVFSDELVTQLNFYWLHSGARGAKSLRGKPGPYSIILPTIDDDFSYLHRGGGTIAFRLPNKEDLRAFLRETGPLVAPSANMEGESPAKTIAEARKYFGTDADFYIDGGELAAKPSTIIKFTGDEVTILRE